MNIQAVETFLRDLQQRYCSTFEAIDGGRFRRDTWQREEGGGGLTCILENGAVFERVGVGFSMVAGDKLPPSASAHRPELAGRRWRALGVSLVAHPRNPYAPTSHFNVRFFVAEKEGEPAVWWFGGGFDLTPYYGDEDDCRQWHAHARAACEPLGAGVYPQLKKACDEYFYLKHRQEPRGIGGIFFDDWSAGGFDESFAFLQRVGEQYMLAYAPIVRKQMNRPYGETERAWQLARRGRYVEFNLVWDRGTLFGLQSGGRTESILMSMPPAVTWSYMHQPSADSAEARLLDYFLKPRDWLAAS